MNVDEALQDVRQWADPTVRGMAGGIVLADAIERVRALHHSIDERFANGDVRSVCAECCEGEYHPCETILALNGP